MSVTKPFSQFRQEIDKAQLGEPALQAIALLQSEQPKYIQTNRRKEMAMIFSELWVERKILSEELANAKQQISALSDELTNLKPKIPEETKEKLEEITTESAPPPQIEMEPMKEEPIPKELLCPLSKSFPIHPVIIPPFEESIYEKSDLLRYFDEKEEQRNKNQNPLKDPLGHEVSDNVIEELKSVPLPPEAMNWIHSHPESSASKDWIRGKILQIPDKKLWRMAQQEEIISSPLVPSSSPNFFAPLPGTPPSFFAPLPDSVEETRSLLQPIGSISGVLWADLCYHNGELYVTVCVTALQREDLVHEVKRAWASSPFKWIGLAILSRKSPDDAETEDRFNCHKIAMQWWAQHQEQLNDLFATHSNVCASYLTHPSIESMRLVLVVNRKGFIPYGEKPFPKYVEGVKTEIRSGSAMLLSST